MMNSSLKPWMQLLGRSIASGRISRRGGLIVVALLVGLVLWLPELFQSPQTSVRPTAKSSGTVERSENREAVSADRTSKKSGIRTSPSERSLESNRAERLPTSDAKSAVRPDASSAITLATKSGQTYRSPAGLVYTRGSAQGHRLQHVLEHGQDQPDRPGSHGVFADGSLEAIVVTLDEAYKKYQNESGSQGGSGVRVREEEGRTIVTVDMHRSVGYIGGQSGNRRGRPEARHVRMVLEGPRLITAYPIIP